MQLLVSVASAAEAGAALTGGADIIDAKDPLGGALGAVSVEVLRDIHAAVAGARPVTAALGDATDEARVERDARSFAGAGAALVKIGFAGVACPERVAALAAAAARGATTSRDGRAGVVVVAYADCDRARSLPPEAFVALAARAGADGLLLDTIDKAGPGLCSLVTQGALAAWAANVHAAGLFVALAGKLTGADFPFVRDAGADVVGVRGAACDGGRVGRVTGDRVRRLRELCADLPSEAMSCAPVLGMLTHRPRPATPSAARSPGQRRQSPATHDPPGRA